MIYSIFYAVLSVLNCILFVIGVTTLPGEVPIRFDGELPKAMGSPWTYVAFPAAAVFLSAALFLAMLLKKEWAKTLLSFLLALIGGALVTVGWVFFAMVKSVSGNAQAAFPYALAVMLPIVLTITAAGGLLPKYKFGRRKNRSGAIFEQTLRLVSVLVCAAGTLSAAATILLTWFCPEFAYLSAIVAVLAFAFALIFPIFRIRALPNAETDGEKTE